MSNRALNTPLHIVDILEKSQYSYKNNQIDINWNISFSSRPSFLSFYSSNSSGWKKIIDSSQNDIKKTSIEHTVTFDWEFGNRQTTRHLNVQLL